jgi:hypothetical protein
LVTLAVCRVDLRSPVPLCLGLCSAAGRRGAAEPGLAGRGPTSVSRLANMPPLVDLGTRYGSDEPGCAVARPWAPPLWYLAPLPLPLTLLTLLTLLTPPTPPPPPPPALLPRKPVWRSPAGGFSSVGSMYESILERPELDAHRLCNIKALKVSLEFSPERLGAASPRPTTFRALLPRPRARSTRPPLRPPSASATTVSRCQGPSSFPARFHGPARFTGWS